MLNISLQDQNLLFKQANLKKLENNTYLKDVTNENYKYIKNKFFLYDEHSKAQLLNIGSGLFGTIADVYAFYVGNPEYEFGIMFDKFVRDLVTLGFCCISISRLDGQEQITYEPAKNYWNDNGVNKTSRIYQDENEVYYVLVSSYYPGYIENKLYRMTGSSLRGGIQVPLNQIRQTSSLEETVQTGLTIPSLIVVEEGDYSIVEKITSLVYGVDRQVVMNHTQYLQNVESFILFKNINRPEKLLQDYNSGKKIDFSQIGRVINGGEDSQIEFIDNVNTLIDKSILDADNYIRRISSVSKVPIEFLGIESKEGSVGEGSRTLRHGAFMKKVQYYRDLIDGAIEIFMNETGNTETYTWPDIFAKSSKDLAEELKTARESEIISQFTAIKKYNGYTEDETQMELDLINSQNTEDEIS